MRKMYFTGIVIAILTIAALSVQHSVDGKNSGITLRERGIVYCKDAVPRKDRNKDTIKRHQPKPVRDIMPRRTTMIDRD